MTETFDNRQLRNMSEDLYQKLRPNGQLMTYIKELATLNQER